MNKKIVFDGLYARTIIALITAFINFYTLFNLNRIKLLMLRPMR